MPLIESEPDALAKVYAKGLFEAAEQGGVSPEAILDELEDILELARHDPDFSELLASRLIGAKKRDAALGSIFEGRVSPVTLRFLRLLNRKSRLGHLSPMVGALDALVQQRFGRVEVDVFTAAPLNAEGLDAIRTRLSGTLGREVIVHPYTDSGMLGGIKLRIGDQLIDASVRAELRRLRDRLIAEGGTIRGRSDRIIDPN